MNKLVFILVVVMIVQKSYAAPIKNDPTTQDAATTSIANIPKLLANARLQVFHMEQSVVDLEREIVSINNNKFPLTIPLCFLQNETFNMTPTNCYVRSSTNTIVSYWSYTHTFTLHTTHDAYTHTDTHTH